MTSHRGYCFIFSAPSGCGKSTIVKRLCDLDSRLITSVSTTTRPKRAHEIDGQHYFFVSDAQFDELISKDAFLEYATVFKYRYGTQREVISKSFQNGLDVMFDVDWQGARSIKQKETNVFSFFLIPPSLDELRLRLVERGQDSIANVDYRMSRALSELSHYNEFDYVIVNDVLNTTCDLIRTCIEWIRRGERYSIPPIQHVLKTMLDI